MPLIMDASQSRTLAYEALQNAKSGDREAYNEKMSLSRKYLIDAHKKQTSILNIDAAGSPTEMDVFLVHAMDHVTNAQLIHDIVKELAELHMNK
ncbi:PTS lactose/cellobiose transporter subunit IIA [Salinicoccus sesuvii]|uniref:PTS lactose/cellobiose transporter subunit IIA n=1 Tax=Salinicoccus sesuvii TaxID=868281 RepID=A0ABV7N1N4_9STAP